MHETVFYSPRPIHLTGAAVDQHLLKPIDSTGNHSPASFYYANNILFIEPFMQLHRARFVTVLLRNTEQLLYLLC